jgi:hypothetical protein
VLRKKSIYHRRKSPAHGIRGMMMMMMKRRRRRRRRECCALEEV